MFKRDIKYIIVFVLLIIITHDTAPDWCSVVADSIVGDWLQVIYDIMSSYYSIKYIAAALTFLVGLYFIWVFYRDKDFRWYRPLILVWICVLLFDHNTFVFVRIWGDFDFGKLIAIICGLALIGMVLKLANRFWPFFDYLKSKLHKKQPGDNTTQPAAGFLNDEINSKRTPDTLQKYAETIIDQLLRTDISTHSFAVGITGEWGSGKTTFLNVLENKLNGRVEIVSFNPWMCRTPEQVTDDFFATLRQQLSPYHSSFSKPIHDYARYFSNATFSLGNGFLSKISLGTQQDSLQKKKQRLSERFATLKKPIVVIIDDLDRLESSEVFEVLRLIRNTADIKNIIYLVAYDKEYVTHILMDKGIKDSTAYLEKIFPVEIHQPKVEDYQILQLLRNDLDSMKIFKMNFADELLRRLTGDEKELIVKILGNYRQTRRFVRVYSLNVLYIQRVFTNEIKLMDLFWMELLQTYDKTVYDLLNKETDIMLYSNAGRYILRPGIDKDRCISKEEKQYEYKGEIRWKDGTDKILMLLFGKYAKVTAMSICKVENFDKFFTLSVSPYRLSKSEFNSLFLHKGKEEETVRQWIEGGKYYSSVRYQFENCQIVSHGVDELESYIRGVLSYGLVLGEYNIDVGYHVRSLLESEHFQSRQIKSGKDVILQWSREKIDQHCNFVAISKLFNRLYVPIEYDEDNRRREGVPLLISNEDVAMLLQKVMRSYLEQHHELTPLHFYDEKSEPGRVFKNCCVLTEESMMTDEFNAWKNVAIDVVGSRFVNSPKLSLKDEKDAYNKMYMDDIPDCDDDPDAQDFIENAYEQRSYKLKAYFGSNDDAFQKFITMCFSEKTELNKINGHGASKSNIENSSDAIN